jgi:hypothetical protein
MVDRRGRATVESVQGLPFVEMKEVNHFRAKTIFCSFVWGNRGEVRVGEIWTFGRVVFCGRWQK